MIEDGDRFAMTAIYGIVSRGEHSGAAAVTFTWRADDPAAIAMTVKGTRWTFDRDLLAGKAFSGGDVLVGRNDDVLAITLRSPEGEATIAMRATAVDEFVGRVEALCPEPTYDVDSWLRELT